MKWTHKILHCRRTFISLISIICLTILGLYLKSVDVATSIAAICIGLSASNAAQVSMVSKNQKVVAPTENP